MIGYVGLFPHQSSPWGCYIVYIASLNYSAGFDSQIRGSTTFGIAAVQAGRAVIQYDNGLGMAFFAQLSIAGKVIFIFTRIIRGRAWR